jgi:integrating conjugative element protein (TIGR03759 family)
MMPPVRLLLALSALAITPAWAAEPVSTAISNTRVGSPSLSTAQQDAMDQTQAQVWGLTVEEIQRARMLMQPGSPRSAFSAPNISPVEVLGIHAATAAERQRYATLFAKALRADTERVLAWTVTYGVAAKRLYPNEKVLDFGKYKIPKSQEIYLR